MDRYHRLLHLRRLGEGAGGRAGAAVDRKGQPTTLKLTGPVEAWYEDLGDDPPVAKRD